MKDKRYTLLDNLGINGLTIIAFTVLIVKHHSIDMYMLTEYVGVSLVFTKVFTKFKLSDNKYDKTFYALALAVILVSCLNIFTW